MFDQPGNFQVMEVQLWTGCRYTHFCWLDGDGETDPAYFKKYKILIK